MRKVIEILEDKYKENILFPLDKKTHLGMLVKRYTITGYAQWEYAVA